MVRDGLMIVGSMCCGWVVLGLIIGVVGLCRAPAREDWD